MQTDKQQSAVELLRELKEEALSSEEGRNFDYCGTKCTPKTCACKKRVRELGKRYDTVIAALANIAPEPVDAVAYRFDFDGYGWRYIDSGSGSDWEQRALTYPDAQALTIKETPHVG